MSHVHPTERAGLFPDAADEAFAKLRAFCKGVMESWPIGDVDGGSLQDMAIRHGLLELKEPRPTEPCGEHCTCAEYYASDEFAEGIECYRKTPLLTGAGKGAAQSPATIDDLWAEHATEAPEATRATAQHWFRLGALAARKGLAE